RGRSPSELFVESRDHHPARGLIAGKTNLAAFSPSVGGRPSCVAFGRETMKVFPSNSGLIAFKEQGSGPALLLVHGLMISGEMFEPVIGEFAVRHRVIVPDLRGHGRSRSLPPPYSTAQHAADLSRLLGHLGIDQAAVLGYSQGGAAVQQLALDYP